MVQRQWFSRKPRSRCLLTGSAVAAVVAAAVAATASATTPTPHAVAAPALTIRLDSSLQGFLDSTFAGTSSDVWPGNPTKVRVTIANPFPLVASFRLSHSGGASSKIEPADLYARFGFLAPERTDVLRAGFTGDGTVLLQADLLSGKAMFVNFFGRAIGGRVVSLDDVNDAVRLMQTDPGRLLVKIFKQTGEAYLVRHSKLAALKVLSKGLIRFGVSRENRKWLFNALKTFGRHLKAIGPGWVVEMGKQIGAYLALATSHINPTGIVRVYAEAPTPPPATGTGQITAVCPSSDAYIDGSDPETSVPFERCSSDWSDSGIEQPDGIVCNGHVDDALDNTLAFRFLRDGSVVFQATPRTIDDVLGSSGDWFQRWTPGGGAVAPGAYTCQLQLNGQVVAEQAFSVY